MSTTFLCLPAEVRMMIYHHAFANRRLRFARQVFGWKARGNPVAAAKIDASTALLVCCKTIYQEALPLFYSLVHLNVDGILNYHTGLLHSSATDILGIDRTLIHHISIDEKMFRRDRVGALSFIDSLTNLKSLTYHCSSTCNSFYLDEKYLNRVLTDQLKKFSSVMKILEIVVNMSPYRTTGLFLPELPGPSTQSLIEKWRQHDKRYRLIAEVDINTCETKRYRVALLDMDTKVMTVVEPKDQTRVVGSFPALDLEY